MKSKKFLHILLLVFTISVVLYGAVGTLSSSKSSLATNGSGSSTRNALTAAAANSVAAANDQLVVQPDDGTRTILSLINHASSSLDLVMYELSDPDIESALNAAQSRGVHVRVLLNHGYYGTPSSTNPNQAAYDYFQAHNVPVEWTPSSFALTHEKSLVVDGTQAFIMTFNLVPKYYATGRDFGVIDTDAPDVQAMSTTFDADWNNTSITAPTGNDLVWSPDSETALLAVINGAQKTLDVYTEELSDPDIVQALVAAQKRGVDVRVVMTYSSEWKDAFTSLTNAGVEVRTFADNQSAPVYIHAKMMVADNTYVFLGSENFTTTSMSKNRELGLIISNTPIADTLETTFESDWNGATPFTTSS